MTEGECSRCGACCRVLPLLVKGMNPEYLGYLRTRGLKEDQGFILIPHDCQHLKADYSWEDLDAAEKDWSIPIPSKMKCMIHESPDRPALCCKFHGQKRGANHTLFYVPPGCTMRKEP